MRAGWAGGLLGDITKVKRMVWLVLLGSSWDKIEVLLNVSDARWQGVTGTWHALLWACLEDDFCAGVCTQEDHHLPLVPPLQKKKKRGFNFKNSAFTGDFRQAQDSFALNLPLNLVPQNAIGQNMESCFAKLSCTTRKNTWSLWT